MFEELRLGISRGNETFSSGCERKQSEAMQDDQEISEGDKNCT